MKKLKTGFRPKYSIDFGISELIKGYKTLRPTIMQIFKIDYF